MTVRGASIQCMTFCAHVPLLNIHAQSLRPIPPLSHASCRTLSSLRSFLLLVQLPYKLEDRRGNLQSCVNVENSPSCCTTPPRPPQTPPPPNCRDPQGPINPPCLCLPTLHRRPCCLSCYTVILTISLSGWI